MLYDKNIFILKKHDKMYTIIIDKLNNGIN